MSRTKTEEEYRQFQSAVVGQPRRDLRRWVVAGVAAAVVGLAVGVALWSSDPDREGSQLPAATVPDATSAANLAAAEAVAAAFAAHDTELLAPYLEPGLSPPASTWETEMKRDAAWSVEYLLEPCTQSYETFLNVFVFECPYSLHLLGSREVGQGPFPDNRIVVIAQDGKIQSADTEMRWQTNGISPYLDAVAAWLEENPPTDSRCAPRSPKACATFMNKDEVEVTSSGMADVVRALAADHRRLRGGDERSRLTEHANEAG